MSPLKLADNLQILGHEAKWAVYIYIADTRPPKAPDECMQCSIDSGRSTGYGCVYNRARLRQLFPVAFREFLLRDTRVSVQSARCSRRSMLDRATRRRIAALNGYTSGKSQVTERAHAHRCSNPACCLPCVYSAAAPVCRCARGRLFSPLVPRCRV